MPTIKTPHEFLVRWDDAGKLQGAHIVHRESFTDDAGVEQFSKFTDPSPVALTDSTLLSTISADINVVALTQIEALVADKAVAEQAKTTAEAERDAAIRDKTALTEQLAALQITSAPRFIKKWQLTAGMRKDDPSGTLLTAFNSVIAGLPPAVKEMWDGSSGVEEDSPFLVLAKAAPLNLSDAQIASMFERYPKITQADVLALV